MVSRDSRMPLNSVLWPSRPRGVAARPRSKATSPPERSSAWIFVPSFPDPPCLRSSVCLGQRTLFVRSPETGLWGFSRRLQCRLIAAALFTPLPLLTRHWVWVKKLFRTPSFTRRRPSVTMTEVMSSVSIPPRWGVDLQELALLNGEMPASPSERPVCGPACARQPAQPPSSRRRCRSLSPSSGPQVLRLGHLVSIHPIRSEGPGRTVTWTPERLQGFLHRKWNHEAVSMNLPPEPRPRGPRSRAWCQPGRSQQSSSRHGFW